MILNEPNKITTKEINKRIIEDAVRFLNDRARLEYALRQTLESLGVGMKQIIKIVNDVRLADFDSLRKTMRIDKT